MWSSPKIIVGHGSIPLLGANQLMYFYMETIRQYLVKRLVSNGCSEKQATEIISIAEPSLQSLVEGYHFTLDSNVDSYPKVIYDILFVSIKPIALEYIEKNIPMAWFKPMFT